MQINIKTGFLEGIEFIPSPNFNERPKEAVIDLLVIHNISLPAGNFSGDNVTKLFLNQYEPLKDLQVSAHLFIRRGGDMIQFVPFHLRAWHAGKSIFEGRENCNDFSIGIELEGTDTIAYEEVQYQQLQHVVLALQAAYPAITSRRIVGHSDIAPNRKTDPGPAFCWEKIL